MLGTLRRLEAPELDASYELLDRRTPSLRVGVARGRNVTTDFALVDKVAPFIHRLAGRRARSAVTIVLRGRSRFDEGGRRGWIAQGSFVASDLSRAGSEAHGGEQSEVLIVEWDARAHDASFSRGFAVEPLARADLARLSRASMSLRGEGAADAVIDVFRVLRSVGFPIRPPSRAELASHDAAEERARKVQAASDALLSRLETSPAIEELVDAVGSNARQVHRDLDELAHTYALPWTHWRAALHQTRMAAALRLLSAPRATTEAVARLTGFRSPSALCHALAKGGLPSPGVLARAARRDALEAWAAWSSADAMHAA